MSQYSRDHYGDDRRDRFQRRVLLEVPKHRGELDHSAHGYFYEQKETFRGVGTKQNYQSKCDYFNDNQSHYAEVDALSNQFKHIDVVISPRGAHLGTIRERESRYGIGGSMIETAERCRDANIVQQSDGEQHWTDRTNTSYLHSIPSTGSRDNRHSRSNDRGWETEYVHHYEPSPISITDSVGYAHPYRTRSDRCISQTDGRHREYSIPQSASCEDFEDPNSSTHVHYGDKQWEYDHRHKFAGQTDFDHSNCEQSYELYSEGEFYDQTISQNVTLMNYADSSRNKYDQFSSRKMKSSQNGGNLHSNEIIDYHHQSPNRYREESYHFSPNREQSNFHYSRSPQHVYKRIPKHTDQNNSRPLPFRYFPVSAKDDFRYSRFKEAGKKFGSKYHSYNTSDSAPKNYHWDGSGKVKDQNLTLSQKYETADIAGKMKSNSKSCHVSMETQKAKDKSQSPQTPSSSDSGSKSLESSQSDIGQSSADQLSPGPGNSETLHKHEMETRKEPSSKLSDINQSVVKSSSPASPSHSQIESSLELSQSNREQIRDDQSTAPNSSSPGSANQSVNNDQSHLCELGSSDHPSESDVENHDISTDNAISSGSDGSTMKHNMHNKSQLSEKFSESRNKENILAMDSDDSNRTSDVVSHAENEILSESDGAALSNQTLIKTINQTSLVISPEKVMELHNVLTTTEEGTMLSENNGDIAQSCELHVDTKQHKKSLGEENLELLTPLPVDSQLKEDSVDSQEMGHLESDPISDDTDQVMEDCEADNILEDDMDLSENVEPCEDKSTATDPQISVETSSDPASNSLPKLQVTSNSLPKLQVTSNSLPKLHESPFKISQSSSVDIQKLCKIKSSPVLKKVVNRTKSGITSEAFTDMPVLIRISDLNEEKFVEDSSKKMETVSQGIGEKQSRDGSSKIDTDFKNIFDLYDSDEIDLESDSGESDDDDDDDELVAAPSFLRYLDDSSKSQPTTPHSLEVSQLDDSQLEMPVLELQVPITSQFTLDQMLAEKIGKADELRKHKEMQTELKEHLRHGGFIKLTLEKHDEVHEDELSLEQGQQQLLKNFQVSESALMEVHPGDEVFQAQNFGQLFTESLTPQDCGFQPGDTYVDALLVDIQPADYDIVLTSDVLLDCLDSVSSQSAVLRWLFFIMSIHSSHLIMEGCRQILCEAIHIQLLFHKLPRTWAPTVQDILTVFVNYGGDLDELLPESGLVANDLRATISDNNNQMLMQGNVTKFNRENMRQVITIVNISLQARPQFSNEELTTLFKIFSKVALDKSLNNHCMDNEFSLCLASVLQLYSDKDWTQQALHLCRILADRSNNHNNQVHLLQLLMPNSRTSYLRQRTSFIILQQMLFDREEISEEELVTLKLNKLLRMVPVMRDYAHSDMYTLASMVNLLDICVGNDVLKSAEKDDMRTLTDQLKKLTSEVRDNVHMLDCTRIKDMMVRVTSKWTLVMQATGCKQKSIFAYTQHQNSPFMKMETVQSHQSDQSDQSDDDDDGDDDDMKTDRTVSKLIRNRKEEETNISSENMMAVSLARGEDLVKVDTDTVEEMDFADSCDYSDEDILPDI